MERQRQRDGGAAFHDRAELRARRRKPRRRWSLLIRVIAGRFRGRRLGAPKGDLTRPTADRVKEALFSALGGMEGALVLDLYAGTGALGIEAISRGAARSVFVESAPAALEALRKNVALVGIEAETEVLAISCDRATPKLVPRGPFDLVLADPPYAHVAKAVATLEALGAAGALLPGATITLEHSSKHKPTLKGFEVTDLRRYGDTSITIATFSAET